jgi:hypothetical protein
MSALLAPALALGIVLQQLSPGAPPGVPESPAAPPDWTAPAPSPPSPPPAAWPPPTGWPPPPAAWPPPPSPYAAPPATGDTTITTTLPRTGILERGIGLNLLQLGPMEVISSGDSAYGVALGLGVEIDLTPRTALRIPLEINYAGSSNEDGSFVEHSTVFAYVGLTPGITYRFRSERDQRWTAYVGGAVKLGGFMFGRQLLGVAPNPPPATMQEFTRAGAAPELTAGFLFTPFRWLTWRINIDYTYIYVAHTSVHALAETIGPQLSF